MRGNTPRAQADAGMGDIKRQLIYKGRWRHTEVILAPMWFPSSKTCSACGTVNPKLKRERMWTCPDCGTRHDRNLNAAINLRNLIMPVDGGRSGGGQREELICKRIPLHPRDQLWRGVSFPSNRICSVPAGPGTGTLSPELTRRELRYDR